MSHPRKFTISDKNEFQNLAEMLAEFLEHAKNGDREAKYSYASTGEAIIELAEKIKIKWEAEDKISASFEDVTRPSLVLNPDKTLTLTLVRGTEKVIRNYSIRNFYVYKTNEAQILKESNVVPNPGKDGNTWYTQIYVFNPDGSASTVCETLEPKEGPILHEILAQLKN